MKSVLGKLCSAMAILAVAGFMGACGNIAPGDDVPDDAAADSVEPTDIHQDAQDTVDDTGRDIAGDAVTDTTNDIAGDAVTDTTNDTVPDSVDTDVPEDVAQDGQDDTDVPPEFEIRTPEQEALECTSEMGGGSYFISQIDHVCHIANSALTAELYIQTKPVDCGPFSNPTYEGEQGWLKIDGALVAVPVTYEYGGRHHNDQITFVYNDTLYIIGHSSIGYGGRACATPDCLVVCEGTSLTCVPDGTEGVAQDGCARSAGDPAPALQVICVQVNADGTLPAFEDPWTTLSPYGENGEMILPCLGEESLEL